MDRTGEIVRRQIVAMGGTTFEMGLFKSDSTEKAPFLDDFANVCG